MEDEPPNGRKAPALFEISKHERAYEGFFLIDKVSVSFELFEGGWSTIQSLEVSERGDAAAALLYDPDHRMVMLVKQFRLPTTQPFRHAVARRKSFEPKIDRYTGGWLLETAAGMLRRHPNTARIETPEECIRREIEEEVGYKVTDLTKVTEFFSSPGGSNELIHLFYAEVRDWEKKLARGGGEKSEGEDIEIVQMDIEQFFDDLMARRFQDPKIIIAGYWLRDHIARTKLEPPGQSHTLEFRHVQSKRVAGIKTGSITDIEDVEVWVNPENTNMLMDRFFGRSVSAAIRWHGASKRKLSNGREVVERDIIADAIRRQLDGRNFVRIGEAIETEPGELARKGVRSIFHLAIAEGFYEQGLKTDVPTLKSCVDRVLEKIEAKNTTSLRPYRSVLVPMIGTGQGGPSVREVAPALVDSAAAFFTAHPRCRLRAVYFVAFALDDLLALKTAFDTQCARGLFVQI